MKKVISILLLITATLAAKQSNAQVRPSVVKTPVTRPSVAVKSFGIVNHHVSPPPPARLGAGRLMANTIPIVITNNDGSITSSTTTTNPDGSTTSTSTTTNADGTPRSSTTTTTNANGTPGASATTTNNTDGSITLVNTNPDGSIAHISTTTTQNYSDRNVPPPLTIPISDIESRTIIFVWSGA